MKGPSQTTPDPFSFFQFNNSAQVNPYAYPTHYQPSTALDDGVQDIMEQDHI